MSSLGVELWPEYDRPEMLVIHHGLFAADTTLPVQVEFRIPVAAGKPSALAFIQDGQQLNQPYETRVAGDWLVVSFSLATAEFQLEYYAQMALDGQQRTFTYTYPGDYAVTELALNAQVPPTAEGFALDPPADSVTPQGDGLTYHLAKAGPLAQGQASSWTLTYRKADGRLTKDSVEPAPTAAAGVVPESQGGGNPTVLIFVIAFVALAAVGAGAFWLGRRIEPPPPPKPGRPVGSKGASRPGSVLDDALFCHGCGARLRPDADFCHKCGVPVKRQA